MSTSDPNDYYQHVIRKFDRIVDAVLERGYDDVAEDCDDYAVLIQTFEFRKLVTYELYEAYFPPRRHEFELQVLSDLVDAVAASKTTAFLAGSAVGGVIGNASYELLKRLLAYIVRKLRPAKRSHDAFEEVETTLDQIRSYFEERDNVPGDKLYSDLGLEPRKVEPLLKLLGFRCLRKKKRQVWSKPAKWARNT
jgi:hypothetical protein